MKAFIVIALSWAYLIRYLWQIPWFFGWTDDISYWVIICASIIGICAITKKEAEEEEDSEMVDSDVKEKPLKKEGNKRMVR